MFNYLYLLILFPIIIFSYSINPNKPNILFILVDDWGWNDVSYNNSSDVTTPNIDKYATNGLILHKYYAQFDCTQTRSALLSGRYPSSIGMQTAVWQPGLPYGLPLSLKLLPETLKDYGYNTHMVGKWHLGFPSWKYYPLNRGFDSFLGFLNGGEDYYTKEYTWNGLTGYDFRKGYKEVKNKQDTHNTFLYSERILNLLQQSNKDNKPFFIYAAMQLVHTPAQVPQEYINKFSNTTEIYHRLIKQAQTNFFDSKFKLWMNKLKELNMWDNTIVIFTSDNGGEPKSGGNNYPLRGGKDTGYEGGVRCLGFINGGYLPNNRRGMKSNDLFHVTDWYPTLINIINKNNNNINSITFDGIDESDMILYGKKGNRNEILLHIDSYGCNYLYCGGIIWNNWKLGIGNRFNLSTSYDSGWTNLNNNYGTPTINCNNNNNNNNEFVINSNECPYNGEGCLWNLDNDPCEYKDVKKDNINIYNILLNKLKYYNSIKAKSLQEIYENDSQLESADPSHFDGFWTPWQDSLDDIIITNNKYKWYKTLNFGFSLL